MPYTDLQKRLEEIKKGLGVVRTGLGTLEAPTGAGVGVGAETGDQNYSALWKTEFDKSGLEGTKSKVAQFDTDITDRKTKRDQLMLDEKGKPIPQWMITGRVKQEVDAATVDLNRLIDQRNTVAGEYNTGIGEVERKVSYAIDYQKELRRQLEFEKGYGLEERLMKLKETEAGAPEPGKTPEDIETYAMMRLRGEIGPSGVPADIRTEVERRYNELSKTERTPGLTDEVIRAEIRTEKDVNLRTKSQIRDLITTNISMTDADRERYYLILGEMMSEKETEKKEKKGFWERLLGGGSTKVGPGYEGPPLA